MRNEAVYDAIQRLRATGEAGVLATVVGIQGSSPGAVGSKMLVVPGGETVGTVGGGCVDGLVYAEMPGVLRDERATLITVDLTENDDPEHGLICGGRVQVFLEPIQTTHLVICGAGHIGQALAKLAVGLDFRVTVIDDREQFLNAERFPGCALKGGRFEDTLEEFEAPRGSFVVVVTRGHRYDQACLEWGLRQRTRYLGLIGSATKIQKIVLRCHEQGFDREALEGLRAPVGLDVGAVTVEEIAVSIAAELVAVRRRGPGVSRDLREPGRIDPKRARRPDPRKIPAHMLREGAAEEASGA